MFDTRYILAHSMPTTECCNYGVLRIRVSIFPTHNRFTFILLVCCRFPISSKMLFLLFSECPWIPHGLLEHFMHSSQCSIWFVYDSPEISQQTLLNQEQFHMLFSALSFKFHSFNSG